MESKELRDTIINALRMHGSIAASEINGNFFSGTDIAVQCGDGVLKVFRLMIIEHESGIVFKQDTNQNG